MMKKHFGQNIKISIFASLTLIALILALIPLISQRASDAELSVKEKLAVSSSVVDVSSGVYSSTLSGTLTNLTDHDVLIERITVSVGGKSGERQLTLDGFTLPARYDRPIFMTFEGDAAYDRVVSIRVATQGNERILSNDVDGWTFDSLTLLLLGLTAIFGVCLVHSCMVRYYMAQEDRFCSE